MPVKRPTIIGHHLIWTLYGHWLANDLRGSGSADLHEEKFAPLGPVHHGRKPDEMQPSRGELREFYRRADPLLSFSKFWLDGAKRQIVSNAFGEVVAAQGYTVWACAVLSNHAHMVIRRHRDDAITMWHRFADAARLRLREEASLAPKHPVWSSRRTPQEVRTRISYVKRNPGKEGLIGQQHPFVQAYNNWPFHKR